MYGTCGTYVNMSMWIINKFMRTWPEPGKRVCVHQHVTTTHQNSGLHPISLWRIVPALCRWNKATAALRPSTRLTTPSSRPPRPSMTWMSESLASSRGDSEFRGLGCMVKGAVNRRHLSFYGTWLRPPALSLFFLAVTSCWSWWRQRGTMSETWDQWWR